MHNRAVLRRVVEVIIVITCLFPSQPTFAHDLGRPIPVRPEHASRPEVRIWSASFNDSSRFSAFEPTFAGGGFVATGDVDGDGKDDIVVGAGPGRNADVRVFRQDGTQTGSFVAYAGGFRGGVRVAVADTDADGKDEIITAPGPGIAARVHVFAADGKEKLPSGIFFAYDPKFIGGARVAATDLNGDGRAEIITAPGPGGGPHIRVFDGSMANLGHDFFAFDAGMTDGVTVATARTPQGMSIVVAVESWSMPLVRRFVMQPDARLASEFAAFAQDDRSGVSVAAVDVDHDGFDEIATAGNGGRASELRIFDMYGTKIGGYLVQDPNYKGAISMGQIERDGKTAIAVMAVAPVVTGPTDKETFIDVNLTQQRLYAYEHGRIARTFLVSTGVVKHPTPVGKTVVTKKIPIMDYRWYYGPNNPDNYNLKNVKFNLNVFPHIYIHSAYWHNNFGHRMSHGCINTSLKDAEWIYGWAATGTAVETHY